MPEDDDFGFDEDGGDSDSGSGDSGDSGGGGLKNFFSGAILKILMIVGGVFGVVIIAVITASLVAGGKSDQREALVDRQILETRTPVLMAYDIEGISVGTADIDSPHFVRLSLGLAYRQGNMGLQTELIGRRRQITDRIIMTLNAKTRDELHTAQGKDELKRELMKLINNMLIDGQIEDIYFTEIMVN